MSVGVFPFMLQLSLSLCKGKVQELFESFQCLRIQAARNDVRRLYDYLDTTTRGFLMMIHFVFELFTRETVQLIILDHKRKSLSIST